MLDYVHVYMLCYICIMESFIVKACLKDNLYIKDTCSNPTINCNLLGVACSVFSVLKYIVLNFQMQ